MAFRPGQQYAGRSDFIVADNGYIFSSGLFLWQALARAPP
jgi:hypothetical protein